ncbi:MAG TPA: hypothetical protein VGW33_02615 [Terriglobia bacterium]|nr:hypothetical protein [Terriglobia bacterium]
MSIGELFHDTGRIFRRRPAWFLLLATGQYLLITGAVFAVRLTFNVRPGGIDLVSLWRSLPPLGRLGLFLLVWLVSFGVAAIGEAGSLLVASEIRQGQAPALGKLTLRVLAALWRILAAQFALTAACLIAGAFFMIPGLLILMSGALIVPAIVLGNLGIVTAIRKGVKLAMDHFGQVAAIVGLSSVLGAAWLVLCLVLSRLPEPFEGAHILMMFYAPFCFIATLAAIALAVVYHHASEVELASTRPH